MRQLHLLAAIAIYVLSASPVAAHPLGNFTVNHLAVVAVRGGGLRVHYVLDIAEIPTFQIMNGRAPNAKWDAATTQRWAEDEVTVVRNGLRISVDGAAAPLAGIGSRARLRPGAGGLPVLYWVGEFYAPLNRIRPHSITLSDEVYSDRRIGWKDVIVGEQTEPTHELQQYPNALLASPRRVTGATFSVAPSGQISSIARTEDSNPVPGSLTAWIAPTTLSSMFMQQDRSLLFVILTMLAAFGLGALHAIEPGHGKALLAFTLVGARATVKQAVILAMSLTFAHTVSVLLLGVVLLFAVGFVTETIYPWITLVSGIAVAVIGARTLARFVRSRSGLSHVHVHQHDGAHAHVHQHVHDHDHNDAHGHGHSHVVPGSAPLNFSNAIWAAMSGGIAPCPAAIVVLLAAVRLHQVGYGTILIAIFSAGLATVLSALGIGVVHGAAWLSRRSSYARFVPYGPLLSAAVISVVGSWMVGQGLAEQGVAAPAFAIAALTLAAIGGYALSQQHHTHPHAETQPT
ncbi:MAG: hypothetical protein JO101_01025 [Candidatus Eremiobacteraeota bacterium]|nr:hypothetical protein [Candidatus Eremiobacteraeota bacterium]MBV8353873.1 hypothetical protein [Candidatus Eremiobacteraeota bacterium]